MRILKPEKCTENPLKNDAGNSRKMDAPSSDLDMYRKQLFLDQDNAILSESEESFLEADMQTKPRRVALYCRVSTDGQTVENQLLELQAIAERHGWEVVDTFKDEGISGAKGRDQRPGLDALMKAVTRKECDLVAAWSVDRLGRSLPDLIALLSELHAKGVDLYLHQQGIDTTTPGGKAMFQMMGVFAEFERAMIQERVKAGLARARSQGKTLGRPKVSPDTEAAILEARGQGKGIRKIAAEIGVGVATVQRVLAAS